MSYTWYQLTFYLLVYSFLGWALEVCYYAIAKQKFIHRGFLTLPFILSYGVTSVLLTTLLPALTGRPLLPFLFVLILCSVVESLSGHIIRRAAKSISWTPERFRLFGGSGRGVVISLVIAGIYYVLYLLLHPLIVTLALLIPALALQIATPVLMAAILADFILVTVSVRKAGSEGYEYLCSVFTELVFGTVFWDYSDMPLNIGGRTNVLFCFFWG